MSMPSQQLGKQEIAHPQPAPQQGRRKEERVAYLFLMPWFAGLFLFLAMPLVYSLYISMTDRRLISAGEAHFVGLQNYVYMFTQDAFFYKSLLHNDEVDPAEHAALPGRRAADLAPPQPEVLRDERVPDDPVHPGRRLRRGRCGPLAAAPEPRAGRRELRADHSSASRTRRTGWRTPSGRCPRSC